MAPRKRGVPPSTDHHPKKRTKKPSPMDTFLRSLKDGQAQAHDQYMQAHNGESASWLLHTYGDDLTARNAGESPLLRLPAEIREIIWFFAFGGRNLHIQPDGYGLRLIHATYSNPPCDSTIEKATKSRPTDPRILSILNDGRHAQADADISRRISTRISGLVDRCRHELLSTPVPLVSKQLYHEAVPCIWRHNTFSVSSPFALRYAFQIPQARLDLVELLSVVVHEHHIGAWRKLVTHDLLASMRSLKRVRFIVENGDPSFFTGSTLGSFYDHFGDLDSANFQLEHITIQKIGGRKPGKSAAFYGPASLKEYAEHLRNILLQYVPPPGPRHSPPEQLPIRRSARLFAQWKESPRYLKLLKYQRVVDRMNQMYLKVHKAQIKDAESKSLTLRS